MAFLRLLLISAVTLLGCAAQQSEKPKPPCNARNRGQLWPEPKDRDACHPVEMCTEHRWKYRWQPLTVDVSQLSKDPKVKSACEATRPGDASAGGSKPQGTREDNR